MASASTRGGVDFHVRVRFVSSLQMDARTAAADW